MLPAVVVGSVTIALLAVALAAGTYPGQLGRASVPVPVDAAEFGASVRERSVSRDVNPADRRVRPSTRPSPSASPTGGVVAPRRAPTAPRIAGLEQNQARNAQQIVVVGRDRELPRRAQVIAIATALQESNLRNLANPGVPESLRQDHEGTGSDFDSVGLFQQRPSQGWGTVEQLMTPRFAASAFYARLVDVPDWQELSVAEAAQAVQRSALPDAYAKHEVRAAQIVARLSE